MVPKTIQKDVLFTVAERGRPEHINEYITAYGGQAVKDRKQALASISAIVLKNGKPAFERLAVIHPDRDFVLESMKSLAPDKFSSCDGCGGKCGGANSNADGDKNPNKITETTEKKDEKKEVASFLEKNGTTILFVVALVAVVSIIKK